MREADSVKAVRRKVDRLRRARGQKPSLFRALAHVGVLGWLMILPLVALTALGHALDVMFDMRSLALSGVLSGLVIGGYLVWRSVDRELGDPSLSEAPADGTDRANDADGTNGVGAVTGKEPREQGEP